MHIINMFKNIWLYNCWLGFILIFIYYGLFSLPEINFKNMAINIDTLFEERSNLKQQIWELQNKIKELEEKLNKWNEKDLTTNNII